MKTLYQEILATKILEKMPDVLKHMEMAEVFCIQNVADYYMQSPQGEWDMESDFPNLAPPFSNFWMEYTLPKTMNVNNAVENIPISGKIGMLFISHKEKPENVKWAMSVILFMEVKNRGICIPIEIQLGIDEKGKIAPYGNKLFYMIATSGSELEGHVYATLAFPGYLALSFLHCKNVSIIKKGISILMGKRNRHQGIKYHVLDINPMKQVIKTEGNIEVVGLRKALHICRGHFKDFTEKGLFGKYHDIYWWNDLVRGNVDSGIVLKDYRVKANS
jgi:hypothetical protein